MLVLVILTNTSLTYEQKAPPNTPKVPSSSSSLSSSKSSAIPNLQAVRIISPAKGQQISTSKDLVVYGITSTASSSPSSPSSSATATTNSTGKALTHNCQVSMIVNGVKPYQPAKATGKGGPADYSKWIFVISSKNGMLKQGPNNKITAKYVCSSDPGIVSHYSINVTGIAETIPIRSTMVNASSQSVERTSPITTASHALPSTNLTSLAKTVPNNNHLSNTLIKPSDNDSRSHAPTITMGSGISSSKSGGSINVQSNNGNIGFAPYSKPPRTTGNPDLNPTHAMTNELKNRIIENLRKGIFRIP
ncbi:MAG: hypothetical protein JO327_07240 [Nitrososphaeraceae archaeon]|nr:hypothetical protein [Nitrososphaeraceae archaeon]